MTGRAVRTRFRCGYAPEALNLALYRESSNHYAKGTQSAIPLAGHRPPTACTCMVSGTFHSPHRGSFHFSLALLVAIGRREVLSLTGWSPQIHTGFLGTRVTWDTCGSLDAFAYEAVTLSGGPFQSLRLAARLVTSWRICGSACRSRNSRAATATSLARRRFGLVPFRSPLLRESSSLSFPGGTEMFQFPPFPATRLWIHRGLTEHYLRDVSASKKSPDQCLLSGSPRLIAAMPRLSSALDA